MIQLGFLSDSIINSVMYKYVLKLEIEENIYKYYCKLTTYNYYEQIGI